MYDPDVERFEVRFRKSFKGKIAEAAAEEGISLGELIVRATARWLEEDEDAAVPEKKILGRHAKIPAKTKGK